MYWEPTATDVFRHAAAQRPATQAVVSSAMSETDNHRHADGRGEDLMECFLLHVQGFLRDVTTDATPHGPAADDLRDRGFNLQGAGDVPIGLFVDCDVMETKLRESGFIEREIALSRLTADRRLAGRLVGAIRDFAGKIVSFWARHPDGEQPKYLYLDANWSQSVPVCGLGRGFSPGQGEPYDLLIVSDPFDAALLQSWGISRAVAAGSGRNKLTESRWEQLALASVRSVMLALDHGPTGDEPTLAAIEAAARAECSPAVFVLPPESLQDAGSAAELVSTSGPEALRSLLSRQAIHAYRYKAWSLLSKHDSAQPRTEAATRAALDEAITFCASASRASIPEIDTFFVPLILDQLGLGWDTSTLRRKSRGHQETFEPVEPVCESPEPAASLREDVRAPQAESEPAAPTETDAPASPIGPGFCTMHRCGTNECFCWD